MLRLMIVRSWLKLPTHVETHDACSVADSTHRHHGLPGPRFAASIGVSISLGLALTAVGGRLTSQGISDPISDCPCAPKSTNLVFIIDRSGSFQDSISKTDATASLGRGQTYNVEINGVVEALLNPSIIPRDGSVSVGVVLFDGAASVPLRLTPRIISEVQARALATDIEALRCEKLNDQVYPCPSGATSFDAAISEADRIAQLRPADRRLLIMSTDGERTDEDKGNSASADFLQHAIQAGVEAELDVILIGLERDTKEFSDNYMTVSDVVIPPAPNHTAPEEPPGAVKRILSQPLCNAPGASFGDACISQARQFADFIRNALRSSIRPLNLTVGTLADSVPNTPVASGSPMSLRQAIEMANSNCGKATITFDSTLRGKSIQPDSPLPPLAAPDITICGCCAGCSSVLIDQPTCFPANQGETAACNRITIDGQGKFSDGIQIRSNRDVVRGLLIKNFTRAGVVIQPLAPCDNTGFNKIELNVLENNLMAGVCVLDPPDKPFAIAHNIGNTISMNDISGSETPIDLGSAAPFTLIAPSSVCDGPTRNDVGDPDEGPNHLLNFPDDLTAETTGNTVTITGKANGPGAPFATVEIFAVQKFNPSNGKAAVTAVTFFKSVTAAGDGSFAVVGPSASPILGYTATITDIEGNTSELRTFCSGPALALLDRKKISFEAVDAGGTPPTSPQSREFTISNAGCSTLQIASVLLLRKENEADVGRIKRDCICCLNDSQTGSGFFSVMPFASVPKPAGCATGGLVGFPIVIAPGMSEPFQVQFKPVIPKVVTHCQEAAMGLSAGDVLPSAFRSGLSVNSNEVPKLRVIARVATAVKLIDPDFPSRPAKVTLRRAGDDLFVTFSVFDSNLDVNRVDYKFFKTRNNQCTEEEVPAEIVDRDLGKAIASRNPKLVTGQSFTVIQRFSGALDNPEAGCVQVTVSDGEANPSPSVTSSLTGESSPCASIALASVHRPRGAIIVRPAMKLPGSSRGSRASIVNRTASVRHNINRTTSAERVRHASSRKRRIR